MNLKIITINPLNINTSFEQKSEKTFYWYCFRFLQITLISGLIEDSQNLLLASTFHLLYHTVCNLQNPTAHREKRHILFYLRKQSWSYRPLEKLSEFWTILLRGAGLDHLLLNLTVLQLLFHQSKGGAQRRPRQLSCVSFLEVFFRVLKLMDSSENSSEFFNDFIVFFICNPVFCFNT